MTCESCGIRQVNILFTHVLKDRTIEKNLCKKCAILENAKYDPDSDIFEHFADKNDEGIYARVVISEAEIFYDFVPSLAVSLERPPDPPISNLKTLESPPLAGEFLLKLILAKPERCFVTGDLHEEFVKDIVPKFGLRYAKFWYWYQVFRSLVPVAFSRIIKVAMLGWLLNVAQKLIRKFS